MKYFIDSQNNPYSLENDVQVILNDDGSRTFQVPVSNDGETSFLLLKLPTTLTPIDEIEFNNLQSANIEATQKGPNVFGFINAVKTGIGGIVPSNDLAKTYPLFFPAMQEQDWADLQALVIDAHSKNYLSDSQYAAIKTAATSNNIPLTLP